MHTPGLDPSLVLLFLWYIKQHRALPPILCIILLSVWSRPKDHDTSGRQAGTRRTPANGFTADSVCWTRPCWWERTLTGRSNSPRSSSAFTFWVTNTYCCLYLLVEKVISSFLQNVVLIGYCLSFLDWKASATIWALWKTVILVLTVTLGAEKVPLFSHHQVYRTFGNILIWMNLEWEHTFHPHHL